MLPRCLDQHQMPEAWLAEFGRDGGLHEARHAGLQTATRAQMLCSGTHLLVHMLIFSAVRGGMSSCATFHAAPAPVGQLISTILPCRRGSRVGFPQFKDQRLARRADQHRLLTIQIAVHDPCHAHDVSIESHFKAAMGHKRTSRLVR